MKITFFTPESIKNNKTENGIKNLPLLRFGCKYKIENKIKKNDVGKKPKGVSLNARTAIATTDDLNANFDIGPFRNNFNPSAMFYSSADYRIGQFICNSLLYQPFNGSRSVFRIITILNNIFLNVRLNNQFNPSFRYSIF